MEKFEILFEKLGFRIESETLLTEAFTHKSSVHDEDGVHNERLEFLGDAVLEFVVTDVLYKDFSENEGILTSYRSALVKGEHLAAVARRLDFGSFLILSKGEARSGGAEKDYLLANVVEAFLGALYLDQGLHLVTRFIQEHILVDLPEIIDQGSHIDSKSAFQELTQGTRGVTPTYKVLSEEGMDHEKTFEIGVYVDDVLYGTGVGRSKKEAQLEAARVALEKPFK